ncbi:MAG: efflux transporter periplasmic adaptor subunit [Noviherbaspirillum sp.]|nr:efflux transporter periplasmic adaptor subunit [Noviherbaspirillum sp.]
MKVATAPVTVYDDYPAQTEAVVAVEIRARVSGILERVAFTEGSPVRKDELLFVLDRAQFESTLAQAKAALGQANASYENSRLNLIRSRSLIASRAISQQEFDAAIAKERADAASVEAGKAQVQQANLNLGYTSIRAPRAGLVGRALIKSGGLVNASTTLLTTLYSVDPIYVGFTVSEQKLVGLQKQYGMDNANDKAPEIRLKLIDGSDYPYGGKLDFVDPTINPRNGTLPVRLIVPNPGGALRAGQFVRAIVPLRENPDAILIPEKAVQELQGKHSVYVLGPNDTAVHRDIAATTRIDNKWLVERGLQPGETVIVDGLAKLKPGAPVKPVPAGTPDAVQPGRTGG